MPLRAQMEGIYLQVNIAGLRGRATGVVRIGKLSRSVRIPEGQLPENPFVRHASEEVRCSVRTALNTIYSFGFYTKYSIFCAF